MHLTVMLYNTVKNLRRLMILGVHLLPVMSRETLQRCTSGEGLYWIFYGPFG